MAGYLFFCPICPRSLIYYNILDWHFPFCRGPGALRTAVKSWEPSPVGRKAAGPDSTTVQGSHLFPSALQGFQLEKVHGMAVSPWALWKGASDTARIQVIQE